MPLQLNTPTVAGGTGYQNVVIGQAPRTHHVKVDLSGLTTREVDAGGFIKPGVVLRAAGGLGVLISAGAQSADGVTIEAQRLALATVPPTNATLATETGDHLIAVGTHFHLNQDAANANLESTLSANEIAALPAAMVTLSST